MTCWEDNFSTKRTDGGRRISRWNKLDYGCSAGAPVLTKEYENDLTTCHTPITHNTDQVVT
ncbi:hypothetical protein B0H19DRAFT_1195891, partial [Mycena capillaripes]